MSSINLQCERKSSPALMVKEENKINWEDSTQGKKSVEERGCNRSGTQTLHWRNESMVDSRSVATAKNMLYVHFQYSQCIHEWLLLRHCCILLLSFSLVTEVITIP